MNIHYRGGGRDVGGSQSEERAKIVEDFIQRKREAAMNRQRGNVDIFGVSGEREERNGENSKREAAGCNQEGEQAEGKHGYIWGKWRERREKRRNIVEDFIQRKREAAMNRQRGNVDIFGVSGEREGRNESEERAKIVEDFIQRKREAAMNRQRGNVDIFGVSGEREERKGEISWCEEWGG